MANTQKTTDTREMDTDRKRTLDIPAEGNIYLGDIRDESIAVVSAAGFDDYAKELAFMEELVDVEVHDSTDQNSEPIVDVYVNGVVQRFARGQVQRVKRKYVQVLATARPESIKTETRVHGDTTVNRVTKHSALRYPFTVTEDTKQGREWLRKVLNQAP